MYLTGFADEAAHDLAGQIACTRQLGWAAIESRRIDGTMIHDISEVAFDRVWQIPVFAFPVLALQSLIGPRRLINHSMSRWPPLAALFHE